MNDGTDFHRGNATSGETASVYPTLGSIVLAAGASDTSSAQTALNRFCRSLSVSFGVNTPYAEPMNSCFTLLDYRTARGLTHLGKRIYG